MSQRPHTNGLAFPIDRRDLKSLRDDLVEQGETLAKALSDVAQETRGNSARLAIIADGVLELRQRAAPSPLHYAAIAALAAFFGALGASLAH